MIGGTKGVGYMLRAYRRYLTSRPTTVLNVLYGVHRNRRNYRRRKAPPFGRQLRIGSITRKRKPAAEAKTAAGDVSQGPL